MKRSGLALAAWLALAVAAPREAATGREVVYVASGSQLAVAVATAPLPAERAGAAAATAADRVGDAASEVSLWGPAAGVPPASWNRTGLPGATRLRAPVSVAYAGAICPGCSQAAAADGVRVAALYATARFSAGAEVATLSHLRLRLLANDGAVVWLNGREVARRHIARAWDAARPADAQTGPLWETLYLPRAAIVVGENLLAVEVRPAASTRAPVLDISLAGARGVDVVRGPVLQSVGPGRMAIRFDTDVPARAAIEITTAGQAARTIHSVGGALAVHHEVVVTGFGAGEAVRYRLVVGGQAGPEQLLHFPPSAAQVVRLAVYGDMRGGHAVHGRLVAAMLAEAPDAVLVTGDLVARGHDMGDWQRFFELTAPLLARVPYYPAAGNHDLGAVGDEERRFGELFVLPPVAGRPSWASWYSLDVGGVHVVALDSNTYERPEQEAWLRADLAAARAAGARAILVTVHDGPYSRGPHGGNALAIARYVPILVAGGVDLLFAGHDHIYFRGEKDGLRYIVSGGGGAPLYPIHCGVRDKPRCPPDGGKVAMSEYHYLTVAVDARSLEVCPRRPDRSLLEPCISYPLRRRQSE